MNYKVIVANLDNEIDGYKIESVMSDESLEILDIEISDNVKSFTVNVPIDIVETIENLECEIESISYDLSGRYEDDLHSSKIDYFEYNLTIEALVSVEAFVKFLNDGSVEMSASPIQSIEDYNYSIDAPGVEYPTDQMLDESDVTDIILSEEIIKDKISRLVNSAFFELIESE